MTDPVEALADLSEHLQPGPSVSIRQINVLTSITPRGNVVETAGEFES
jgi:hypothetical protein